MPQLRYRADPNGAEAQPRNDALASYEGELDYVCASLRRLGVSERDIEDLAHEVFLVLHRQWANYDPRRALRPYLFGIAFRVVAAHRRRWSRERPFEALEVPDESSRPDQQAVAKQARALLQAALRQVPLARRAVIVLHDIDEVPVIEIAKTLKIPRFTVYSRLRVGRRELQAALLRFGFGGL